VPQHALNRTRNVVSKPEVVTTAEFVPDVEQRLIEQSHVEQGGK